MFATCRHCGAVWDDRHERDGCPVMAATARVLGATDDEAAEVARTRRRGLREVLRAVRSGRAGW